MASNVPGRASSWRHPLTVETSAPKTFQNSACILLVELLVSSRFFFFVVDKLPALFSSMEAQPRLVFGLVNDTRALKGGEGKGKGRHTDTHGRDLIIQNCASPKLMTNWCKLRWHVAPRYWKTIRFTGPTLNSVCSLSGGRPKSSPTASESDQSRPRCLCFN